MPPGGGATMGSRLAEPHTQEQTEDETSVGDDQSSGLYEEMLRKWEEEKEAIRR